MAVGKNKRISKGNKAGKKKTVNPFAKKYWYDIMAPSMFTVTNAGKKGGNKKTVDPFAKKDWYDIKAPSMFTVTTSEELKHQMLQKCIAYLQNDKDQFYRKKGLRVEDIQGENVPRRFCSGFTQRCKKQVKRTTYAKSCQIRKMVEIMVNQASSCEFKECVAKLILALFEKEIEKATSGIYPLENAFIRKAKILKDPKFDRGGSWRSCR